MIISVEPADLTVRAKYGKVTRGWQILLGEHFRLINLANFTKLPLYPPAFHSMALTRSSTRALSASSAVISSKIASGDRSSPTSTE